VTVEPETGRAIESDSAEQTVRLGEALGEVCRIGDVILLEGPLGAGKTVFAKGVARGLGIDRVVRSPSFIILSRYPGPVPLVHLDLYRVDGETAIEELGLDEQREEGVLLVEWGEKLAGRWPDVIHIRFDEAGEVRRRLVIMSGGEESPRRVDEWLERCQP
jgi:tRNA threonylcarbamoyladenosine biosynthesis protein TsaE